MAGKPNHLLFLLLVLFLFITTSFTSVNARPGPVNAPTGHHHAKVHWSPYDEIVLALQGIKNAGPSPGEGHSFVDGVRN
ncbi:hypothetical protein RHGRI_028244 [Rhododendron griersonianum]|uniref:Transmembrane protein n=1 Tax=Rhododendron griersonianum TaxID=479676 RepID=A0AAV6IF36_9ERIC|nr:hypothetical protein RHGRI_028244 [Rhododendron griersonianum]